MKFVTYNYKNTEAVGILTEDEAAVIPAKSLGFRAESMNELIEELGGKLPELPAAPEMLSLADVKLEAPIPVPKQDVICLGLNYRDHAEEATKADAVFDVQRGDAVYFSKRLQRAVAPNDKSTVILIFATALITKSSLRSLSAGMQRTSRPRMRATIYSDTPYSTMFPPATFRPATSSGTSARAWTISLPWVPASQLPIASAPDPS